MIRLTSLRLATGLLTLMPDGSWWRRIPSSEASPVYQGEYLPQVLIPEIPLDVFRGRPGTIGMAPINAIVLTQSCDLENEKVQAVAVCGIYETAKFESGYPDFFGTNPKAKWGDIKRGRVEGVHLLPHPEPAAGQSAVIVVLFQEVWSLPLEYIKAHIAGRDRSVLASPYLEDFSQAFGLFFMRVALPSKVPPF